MTRTHSISRSVSQYSATERWEIDISLIPYPQSAVLDDGSFIIRDGLNLVTVWEKTRMPKGMSTPEKPYVHRQDRARHYASRCADMSYLIYDEQLLGLEDYLTKLRDYITWYRRLYL